MSGLRARTLHRTCRSTFWAVLPRDESRNARAPDRAHDNQVDTALQGKVWNRSFWVATQEMNVMR